MLPGTHVARSMTSSAGSEAGSLSPPRAPRSARRRVAPVCVDRGTDPVAIPGVEILINGDPWVPLVDTKSAPRNEPAARPSAAAVVRERKASSVSTGAKPVAKPPSRTDSGIAGAVRGSMKGSQLPAAAAEAAVAEAAAAVTAAQDDESAAVDAALKAAEQTAVESPQPSEGHERVNAEGVNAEGVGLEEAKSDEVKVGAAADADEADAENDQAIAAEAHAAPDDETAKGSDEGAVDTTGVDNSAAAAEDDKE